MLRKSKLASVTLLLVCSPLFLLSQETTETALIPLPETVENYFDFWIGDWNVSWDEGEGKTGHGTNNIRPIVGGSAIQEHFEVLEGQAKGFMGTSISTYSQRTKEWKQVWTDSQGSYFDLTGETDGDNRIFKTKTITRNERQLVYRMVFKDIKENSLTWDWERSEDGGNTWTLNWRILYKRKPSKEHTSGMGLGSLNPNAPGETRQFGRLVGAWDCISHDVMPDASWHKSKAKWTFKYGLDGYAIEDLWVEKEEDKTNNTIKLGRDFHGKNIRIYNPGLNQWQCVWIDNRNNSLSSSWVANQNEAGEMVMHDGSGTWRITFYDIEEDSFLWKYEVLRDKQWVVTSKIQASKIL